MGRRSSRRKAWWQRSYGGMPVLGIIAAGVALLGFGVVVALNIPEPATIPSARADTTHSPRPAATRTPEPAPERLGAADVMPRLQDASRPFTIAVFGDSTSVSKYGWQVNVATWFGTAHNRPSTLHPWDGRPEVDAYQPTPWGLTTGDNAPVVMWNASVGSTKSDYPMSRLDRMVPVDGDTVDLIFVNFGHNHTEQNIIGEGKALLRELAERYPNAAIVGMLQNPERAGSPHESMQRNLTRTWKNVLTNQGFDFVDVEAAFDAEPDLDALLDPVGDLHPNEAGYRVWSDAVIRFLEG